MTPLPPREIALHAVSEGPRQFRYPESVHAAEVSVRVLDGAEVSENFLVSHRGNWLVSGFSHMDLRTRAAERVYPELRAAGDNRRPARAIDGEAALLSGGPHGADSYWHWLIDYLPRLWCLEQAVLPANVPLIVNADLTPVQYATLAIYADGRPLVLKAPGERLAVERLWAPSFLAQTGVVYPEVRPFLRRAVRLGWTGAERVYLSRAGVANRPLAGEDRIEALLGAHGFAIVRPHALTFDGQVRACRHARVIVGPHGGGLANAVFAPAGATVIEIATKPRPHTAHASLAAVCGHTHRHVLPGPHLEADLDAQLRKVLS